MASTETTPGAVTRKRDLIRRSQRAMFYWVAGMSVVVGFALVLSWFLWQQFLFQTKVVNAKNDTVSTLKENNKSVTALEDNVRALEANTALNSIKAYPDDKALQAVLDALPADNNPLALSASVQSKLVPAVNGVTIQSLTIDDSSAPSTSEDITTTGSTDNIVPFHLIVTSSSTTALKQLLVEFEKSIRVIDIDRLTLDSASNNQYTLTIDAHGYYEPAQTIELTTKPITAKDDKE